MIAMVKGCCVALASVSAALASSAVRRRFGNPVNPSGARQAHQLLTETQVGDQEINEQRNHQHARYGRDGIPAQLLRLTLRPLLGQVQFPLQQTVSLDLTVGLEARAQRRSLLVAIAVVGRGVAAQVLGQVE